MILQLQDKFKDILYNDQQHRYFTRNGQELTSVTKFLGSLKPKFNSKFWSTFKAYQFSGYNAKFIWNEFNKFLICSSTNPEAIHFDTMVYLDDDHSHLKVLPEDVLTQWEIDSSVGKTRGTYIHGFLDNLENRVTDIPKIEFPENLETGAAINYFNSLETAKKLCYEYEEWARENLILAASEFVVGDPILGLAGRFDRLYFNKSTEKFEIWDFKTDKQIRYKSSFGKLAKFDLPDCEFVKYSLQTSLYRKFIQDALNVELGESKIVWFNLKENRWEIIQTENYINLINTHYADNR